MLLIHTEITPIIESIFKPTITQFIIPKQAMKMSMKMSMKLLVKP